MLWGPVTTAIAPRAARAQTELEVGLNQGAGALAALGGRPSYCIALDALLDRVTETSVTALLDRPSELLTKRFARMLTGALAELQDDPTAEDLASWFGQGGWIDAQLIRAESYLRALVEHRVRRALALVDACCVVDTAEQG
jgi:hypothetical protein